MHIFPMVIFARPLARIWSTIAHAVDDDLCSITNTGKLVWIPAHKSHTAIGNAVIGNGDTLITIDWRANRLVDALAKTAAAHFQAPRNISTLLCSADAAAAHAACLLGVVTHAANNHATTQVVEGGGTINVTLRDSSSRPATTRIAGDADTTTTSRGPPAAPNPPPKPRPVAPWVPPTPKVMANRICRATSHDALVRRIEDIGARLIPNRDRLTAAERLSALAARVRARSTPPPPALGLGACLIGPGVGPSQATSVGDPLTPWC